MPKLNCGVHSCKYQKHEQCSAGAIDVYGKDAVSLSETYCKTFILIDEPTPNSYHEPTSDIKIQCVVQNCMHNNNSNNLCNAKEVKIVGANAKVDSETDCATFITKS